MPSQVSTDHQKPHAVCLPFPVQGHIDPMTKLARLLHHRGFHVTIVHTEYNYRRLLRSRRPASLLSLPSFRFETIPDGLPATDDADVTQDMAALTDSVKHNFALPFKQLLEKLAEEKESPPVTCIVSDFLMPFTLDLAEEMGIPDLQLWTSSAAGFFGCAQFNTLIEKGLVPLEDVECLTNGYLDKVIEWVPEPFKGMRLRDLPSFIRTTDPDNIHLNYVIHCMEKSLKATAVIFNTFEALEGKFLSNLTSSFPPFYMVGPLSLMLDQIKDYDETISMIGSSLWQEEDKCIHWLDSKDPKSVVYVNFGSITVITSQQMNELACGLANSGKNFIWIIRPDLVLGESSMLPPGFEMETKDRILLADWCDQERILKHPAIVGFLTHNGWNSTVMSIFNGLPMISWPNAAEQQTNCWHCCELGIAMEIDNNVKREEVTEKVNELMDGERGMEMKRKAQEWKELAYEAVTTTNKSMQNSWSNFDKMIKEAILSPTII